MLKEQTTLVTIAHSHPGMLQHHLWGFKEFSIPVKHIIWVNGFDDEVYNICLRYSKQMKNVLVLRTPNIGYLSPYNVLGEFITTKYLFAMPDDFRVTRADWLEAYEPYLPAAAVGIPGCPADHVRIGGLLLEIEPFKKIGKFRVKSGLDYLGADYKEHCKAEIRMSTDLATAGYDVKFIEEAPFYDYHHWGRNHVANIAHGTLEQLREFDKTYGTKPQTSTY